MRSWTEEDTHFHNLSQYSNGNTSLLGDNKKKCIYAEIAYDMMVYLEYSEESRTLKLRVTHWV